MRQTVKGKGKLRFCPTNKVCWSLAKDDKLKIFRDMPTYGLEREEIPKEYKTRRI